MQLKEINFKATEHAFINNEFIASIYCNHRNEYNLDWSSKFAHIFESIMTKDKNEVKKHIEKCFNDFKQHFFI